MGKISDYDAMASTTGPEELVGNQSSTTKKVTLSTIFSSLTAILQSIGGDARGAGAIDLQFTRATADQIAGGTNSFIAGGARNKITDVVTRAKTATECYAEGYRNTVLDFYSHVEGTGCIADGKICHAEGNNSICMGNDARAAGNRVVAGARYYNSVTTGSEDAGDGLGVKQFVLINDDEGDVSSYFPNPLTTDLATRYGAGAQADVKGNIYPSGLTPALWTGDIPTTPNDLRNAMHSGCYVRGPSEPDIARIEICKATYAGGTGTKVYYDGAMPFGSLIAITSSYAPTVNVDGVTMGNGQCSEGGLTSSCGGASHAEGNATRAWGPISHSEGLQCQALGEASHAEGYVTRATEKAAHSSCERTEASGRASHAEGYYSAASGFAAHAEGYYAEAIGDNSNASGKESKALRDNEQAYSSGKRVAVGDDQIIRKIWSKTVANAGWWEITIIDEIEDGKAYNWETMVMGVQISGAGGVVGNTWAYKFQGCFTRSGSTYTTIGTPIRTLVGRSVGMSGDGLTTGERMTYSGLNVGDAAAYLRYDGIINTTYRIQTHSWIQEIAL